MTSHHEAASHGRDGAQARKPSKTTKKNGIGKAVDRGTETVERVHRAVASWPLDALGRVGRFEKPVARVRKLQDRSITASYEFVRGVNHEVAQLVRDAARDRRAQARRANARRSASRSRAGERPKARKVVHPEAAATA
jgi:hypothetical protein